MSSESDDKEVSRVVADKAKKLKKAARAAKKNLMGGSKQADILIGIASKDELFRTKEGIAYVNIPKKMRTVSNIVKHIRFDPRPIEDG
jgi:hypothetical protein